MGYPTMDLVPLPGLALPICGLLLPQNQLVVVAMAVKHGLRMLGDRGLKLSNQWLAVRTGTTLAGLVNSPGIARLLKALMANSPLGGLPAFVGCRVEPSDLVSSLSWRLRLVFVASAMFDPGMHRFLVVLISFKKWSWIWLIHPWWMTDNLFIDGQVWKMIRILMIWLCKWWSTWWVVFGCWFMLVPFLLCSLYLLCKQCCWAFGHQICWSV